uniref:RRM domain-containing protein n=1 Tax=Timspurckia oligopyrenoides TaxID=708627 RepID=A0A7S0ZLM5_9RHOD|mmetsp:Transcript_9944/g.17910  ORF Transcript_9944/g.17910 Transcript_9944/m.17910 type:complete len:423 (+) Transcript_9944:157-1425(+)
MELEKSIPNNNNNNHQMGSDSSSSIDFKADENLSSKLYSRHKHQKSNSNMNLSSQIDDTPSSTIVIKNLPLDVSPSTVKDLLPSTDPPPGVKLHTTKGQFKSLGFVSYASVSDASYALNQLKSKHVSNRQLKVEYYRPRNNPTAQLSEENGTSTAAVLPSGDKRRDFFDDRNRSKAAAKLKESQSKAVPTLKEDAASIDEAVKYYQKLLGDFKADNASLEEMQLSSDLSALRRRIVHAVATDLNLGSKSFNGDAGNRYTIVTKDPQKRDAWMKESKDAGHTESLEENIEQMKAKLMGTQKKKKNEEKAAKRSGGGAYVAASSPKKEETVDPALLEGVKFFTPRAYRKPNESAYGEIQDGSSSTVVSKPSAKTVPTYFPPRQPKGPDGTRGFHARSVIRSVDEESESQEPVESVNNATEKLSN